GCLTQIIRGASRSERGFEFVDEAAKTLEIPGLDDLPCTLAQRVGRKGSGIRVYPLAHQERIAAHPAEDGLTTGQCYEKQWQPGGARVVLQHCPIHGAEVSLG